MWSPIGKCPDQRFHLIFSDFFDWARYLAWQIYEDLKCCHDDIVKVSFHSQEVQRVATRILNVEVFARQNYHGCQK